LSPNYPQRIDTFIPLRKLCFDQYCGAGLASYKQQLSTETKTPLFGGTMKSVIFAAFALAVICTAFAVAQDQGQDRHDQQAQSNHHRVTKTNASGWVRKDGDNYVLENDKDKQRYRIQNSETVREHEGHHVKISGRMHEDDRSLEVRSVKRLKDSEQRDHH
jgi:hypothetical protein